MNKLEKAMALLTNLNIENPIEKYITVYGWEKDGTYKTMLYSSVNKYLNEPLSILESLVLKDSINRPGIIKKSTNYITIHDTGSSFMTANAKAHDSYVRGGGNGTSWHYTVGNDGIFHQIPNDEVAFHAGDGSREFQLIDTEVKASSKDVMIRITNDGFYETNNMKTNIIAPLNDEGQILNNDNLPEKIKITIGKNGNYYMGTTYYNKGYKKIGNTGGNRNSIGIESCIDRGSDIYLTWQRLAKLVAYLMEEQNLTIDDVVEHNFFSGKDCPQTMRHADMWNHFLELVRAEYQIRSEFKDIKITYFVDSPYISNNGRIIDLPKDAKQEKYIIHIEDNLGNYLEKTLSVNLPNKKA